MKFSKKPLFQVEKQHKNIWERKMSNLDKNEKELLESFEKGEWSSVKDVSERKTELKEYAHETLHKNKRVNIRISERDLKELQRIASREGLPYQTLISSILHKFVNGIPIGKS